MQSLWKASPVVPFNVCKPEIKVVYLPAVLNRGSLLHRTSCAACGSSARQRHGQPKLKCHRSLSNRRSKFGSKVFCFSACLLVNLGPPAAPSKVLAIGRKSRICPSKWRYDTQPTAINVFDCFDKKLGVKLRFNLPDVSFGAKFISALRLPKCDGQPWLRARSSASSKLHS